ncbi:hypothetical protein D9757_003938 [Collybiopsis confluens]|uniref:Probable RNA-binding protein 18 n=1 Tax=Collybiopsis confluens TaxID=2823264 RepID=A0A8H5HXL3_9AGAR|nr:hypothetical protein D9757_003938 [Collybiopsis confluens]
MSDHDPLSNPLSFPDNTPSIASSNTPPASSRSVLKDRLFIGNLHPSVTEYNLLQMFAKYGKVTKLDFLFHKSGELKGKPRGYAFIEYPSQADAQKALTSANGMILRGRNLVVTHANQAPSDADGGMFRPRKTMMETGRPTTLSLLKSHPGSKHKDGTSNKIAMMEAKLRELQASKPKGDGEPGTSTLPRSTLPSHPSLPMKPLPTLPGASSSAPIQRSNTLPMPALSSSSSEPPAKKMKLAFVPPPADVANRKSGGKGLLGVKIMKKRASPLASTPKSDAGESPAVNTI